LDYSSTRTHLSIGDLVTGGDCSALVLSNTEPGEALLWKAYNWCKGDAHLTRWSVWINVFSGEVVL